VAANLIQTS